MKKRNKETEVGKEKGVYLQFGQTKKGKNWFLSPIPEAVLKITKQQPWGKGQKICRLSTSAF